MQRLVTLGFAVDFVADLASMLSGSATALTTSVLLGMVPAAAALFQLVMGPSDDQIAEFRAEPIRR